MGSVCWGVAWGVMCVGRRERLGCDLWMPRLVPSMAPNSCDGTLFSCTSPPPITQRLADGSGRQVSFRQAVVILISTSHEASGRGGLGFEPAPASQAEAEAAAAQRARREVLDSLKAS